MKFRTLGSHLPWNRWLNGRPETVVVLLPLCHRHRFFPLWWPISGTILSVPLGVIWLLIRHANLKIDLTLLTLVALDLVLLAFLKFCSLGVRAVRINAVDFVLIGLSEEFVRECEALDDRESEQVGDSLAELQEHLWASRGEVGDRQRDAR